MNHVKILFFATIRDRAGTKSLELEIPVDLTIQGLKEKLGNDIPALKESMKSVLITINREYAFDEEVVPPGAEIGMFPPVSGGRRHREERKTVGDEPISSIMGDCSGRRKSHSY